MPLRQKTPNFEHAVASSKRHREDKQIAAERRSRDWIAVRSGKEPMPKQQQPSLLGLGWQFVVQKGVMTEANEKAFVSYLEAQKRDRGWYFGKMKRKGKDSTVRRNRKHAIEQLAVTLAPWQSDFLREVALAKDGKHAETAKLFLSRTAHLICQRFALETGREVLGVSVHLDTQVWHHHIQFTRVSETHQLLGSNRGLHTIGGWACGVKRQLEAGAISDASENASLVRRNLALFTEKHGVLPLDIQLNAAVDEEFDRVFGRVAFAQDCREAYAKRVQNAERNALDGKAMALEAELKEVRKEITLRWTAGLGRRLDKARKSMESEPELTTHDMEMEPPDLGIRR